jgi:hypothetical protein
MTMVGSRASSDTLTGRLRRLEIYRIGSGLPRKLSKTLGAYGFFHISSIICLVLRQENLSQSSKEYSNEFGI